VRRIGRVGECKHTPHPRQRRAQHLEQLELKVLRHGGDAGDVAAGMRKARGEAGGHRRVQAGPDDRYRPRQVLHRKRRKIGGDHDGARIVRQQLCGQHRELACVTSGPSDFEIVVASGDEPDLAHAGVELRHLKHAGWSVGGSAAENPDDGRRLL
jgi:hypothetical protein